MLSKLTLLKKGFALLALVLFLQLALLCGLASLYLRAEHQLEACLNAQAVIEHMDKIENLWSRLNIELPRTLALGNFAESHITQNISAVEDELKAISLLLQGDADARAKLQTLVTSTSAMMAKATEASSNDNSEHFSDYFSQVAILADNNTTRSSQLKTEFAQNQEIDNQEQARLRKDLDAKLWIGLGVSVSFTLLLTYLFIANIASKVERLSRNIKHLTEGLPLGEPEKGDDEIAELDRTFRNMAEALAQVARNERAVVENALDLICTLDANGMFITANSAARSILGCEPDQLVGRSYLDLVVPDDRIRAGALVENISAGSKTSRIECRMTHTDGAVIDILLSAKWSAGDNSFFCVAHSITQRRQIERMKRQFVAMITHDLRNPLTSVLNIFDAISERIYSISSEKGSIRIQQAAQNIDRMLRLISDLTEMGQFDTTSLSLDLKRTSLASIIQESVASVSAYAEQRDITIGSDIVDVFIEADKLRMGQVMTNLLANAIKFSTPGATVSIKSLSQPGMTRIEITDAGPGISEADQKVIFEPYKQAEQQPAEKKLEGTGLGLTICKSIVEAHNGTIGVESAIPKGTTFWIQIPFTQRVTDAGQER